MGTPLKAGDPAPDFSGTLTDGTRVSLKDYRGKKLVMYFYPMDDTPGCTRQACSLRDHDKEIAARGAAILGVSTQNEASHQKFTEKYKLNFPLLADTDGTVGRAYGTIGGPGLLSKLKSAAGMADRVTFVHTLSSLEELLRYPAETYRQHLSVNRIEATPEAEAGWALVSCVVAPGFDFAGFELAPPGWAPDS